MDLQRDDLTNLDAVWTAETWQAFQLMAPWTDPWLQERTPILYASQYGQDQPTEINPDTVRHFNRLFQGEHVESISFALATAVRYMHTHLLALL